MRLFFCFNRKAQKRIAHMFRYDNRFYGARISMNGNTHIQKQINERIDWITKLAWIKTSIECNYIRQMEIKMFFLWTKEMRGIVIG